MADGASTWTGRRRWECALSLQTALLRLDFTVDGVSVEERAHAQEAGSKGFARLARDVRQVFSAFEDLKDHGTAGLCGVPAWLGPVEDDQAAVSGGLGLLRQRLDSGTPVWEEIRRRLAEGPEQFLLTRLERQWADLAQRDGTPDPAEFVPTAPAPGAESGVTVVFPMVHDRGGGFLVEMLIRPRDVVEPGPAEQRTTQKFSQAVWGACRAAGRFSEGVGVPQEDIERWQHHTLTFHGVPECIKPDDTSASAPTAVALTAHLLGLAAPRMLVTGGMQADGTLGSLPTEEQLATKESAASEHGLELLRLDPAWQLPDIGTRLWGAAWGDALARAAQRGLRDLEHEVCVVTDVRSGTQDDDWDFVPVKLEAARDVLQRIKAGAPAIVVGGPGSSARTTAARQAALEHAAECGVTVLEMRLNNGLVPSAHDLRHVIRLARYAQQIPTDASAVVILEDLIPYDDSVNLDAVLPWAAEETSSVIVAACLYSGRARWQTDGLATVPSLSRTDDLWRFGREFARVNCLAWNDSDLSIAIQSSDGDIWWLARLLKRRQLAGPAGDQRREALARAATAVAPGERVETPAFTPPQAETFAKVRRAYVRRTRKRATRAWLKQMKIVAAASLLRIAVPEGLLGGIPADRLMRAGAQRDSRGGWYIARSATCRALLASEEAMTDATERSWKRTTDAQYEALANLIREQPRVYEEVLTRFITALLSAAKTLDNRLYRRLLVVAAPAMALIAVDAPPAVLAQALLAYSSDGPDDERQRLFDTLIRSMFAVGWHSMDPRQAAICLRAIRSYRDFTDWGIRRKYEEVLEHSRDMRQVLGRADPVPGLLFVQELGRLWEEKTRGEILDLAVKATTRCDPRQVQHYEAVVGLVDAAMKYGDDRGAVVNQFARAPGVRRLLGAGDTDDAGLVLARAALHLLLDRNADAKPDALRRRGREAARCLSRSRAASVIVGLSLLERIDRGAARVIVQAAEMDNWLRTILRHEGPDGLTPWHTAQLLRRLGRIDARTVLRVLYQPSGPPLADRDTVGALVTRIIAMGDLKGAGHVVSAVASVDVPWGPGGPDSGAVRLCADLAQFFKESLEHEKRGSVVLAVVTALLEANIPQETLRALLHRCADVVVTEIRESQKEHGPRLALLVGQHPTVGSAFLAMLHPKIEDRRLLDRMTHCQSLEARAAYMDLARALRRTMDDAFVDSFLDQDWLEQSKPELRGGNVLRSLSALRAFTRLLRDMGVVLRDGEAGVLRAVDESPRWWAERLKRLYDPGQWSQALHLLHQLAPGFAVDCLRELDALQRPEARYGGTVTARLAPLVTADEPQAREIPKGPSPARVAQLQRRRGAASRHRGLTSLVERRFIQPEEAVQLVHAVRTIDRETGQSMGAAVSAGANWERKVRSLLDTDLPEQLGVQMRQMADCKLQFPPLHRDRLFKRWRAEARDLRSPAVAQSLLCGFAASGQDGPELAAQLADQLDLDGIASRLGRGFPRDMTTASPFIRALAVWGPSGSAERMAAALPADTMTRVEVADASDLMLMLRTVRPDTVKNHVEAAASALEAQVGRHYVPRAEDHWREMGWLIRTTREAGGAVPDPDDVLGRVAADCRRPEIVAWVEGCLGRFPDPEYWRSDDARAWAEAARLLVHSELGPSGVRLPGDLGSLLPRVSLRWQIHLLRRAGRDGALRATLTEEDLVTMDERGSYLLTTGRPSGAVLRGAVADVLAAASDGQALA
ncbi:hypothetical protein [Streptomyces sp. NPDC006997]|uniref:hypothetical protein n=1 Tax=Streptomyces sp. NPDC006997 TaxID=3155356 RepID=UPI0033F331C8